VSGKLVLIASFPKSGNTWTRIVLERLRRGVDFPLGKLHSGFQGMQRRIIFDDFSPVNAADLRTDEFELLLPDFYRQLDSESREPTFVKVHDMVRRNTEGEWLYPPECVSAAIYIVRHPFDVAVSNAHHFGISVETAVEFLAENQTPGIPDWLLQAPPQYFGTWSENVLSWLDGAPYQIVFARFEDVLMDPVLHFMRFAGAAGLSADIVGTSRVVEASSFAQLQAEEDRYGFVERPRTSARFFRSGRSNSWQGQLDDSLRSRLVRDHGAVMQRLGYTADGGVVDMPS
jgi:aryl sulfotransferase